jgi:hypothetical protein
LKEGIWKGLDEFKNQSWKDEERKGEHRREENEEGGNWKDENGNNKSPELKGGRGREDWVYKTKNC